MVAPNLCLHLQIPGGTNTTPICPFPEAAVFPQPRPPAQASHYCQAMGTICSLSVS